MDKQVDLENVRAYGDHLNDAMVQVSFTLPVECGPTARQAALQLAAKMGLERADVVHQEELLSGFTYFVVYGACAHSVNYESLATEQSAQPIMNREQIEAVVVDRIEREIVVVGASTGTDTHSVGIDAILNMKGYHGHYGLERYHGFRVYNLGSQVPNEVLVAKAVEVDADAVLVSQTVTQQQLHVHNLTQLVDLLEAEGIRDDVILICGGPRISNELAKELGFDAGFSKGCYASHVASHIVNELIERGGAEKKSRNGPLHHASAATSATLS